MNRLARLRDHRQARDRAQARPLPPADLRLRDGERELRPALEQRFKRALGLDARELMAEAEVDSGSEGEMPVGPPLEIEPLRMLVRGRIHIRRRQHRHDLLALLDPDAAEFHVVAR